MLGAGGALAVLLATVVFVPAEMLCGNSREDPVALQESGETDLRVISGDAAKEADRSAQVVEGIESVGTAERDCSDGTVEDGAVAPSLELEDCGYSV